ncbi:protein transport protein Sec24A-like isoform X2 [Ornithodoros turicata]
MMAAPGGHGVPYNGSGSHPPHAALFPGPGGGAPPRSAPPHLPHPSLSQGDSWNVGKAAQGYIGGQHVGPPSSSQPMSVQGGQKPFPNGPSSVNGGTGSQYSNGPVPGGGLSGPPTMRPIPHQVPLFTGPPPGPPTLTGSRLPPPPPASESWSTTGPPPVSGASLQAPRGYASASVLSGTPNVSEPTSAKSSRNASPIPAQRYDNMEGQFVSPGQSQAGQGMNSFPAQQGPPVTSAPVRATRQYPTGPVPSTVAGAPPPVMAHQTLPKGPVPHPPQMPHQQQYVPPAASFLGYGPPPTSAPGTRYPSALQGPPPPPSSLQGLPTAQQAQSTGPVPPTSQVVPPPSAPGPTQSSIAQFQRYPQQLGYNQPGPFASPSLQNIPPPPASGNGSTGTPYAPHGRVANLEPPPGGVTGYDPELHSRMAGMSVNSSFNKLWGSEPYNLLQDRNVLPKMHEDPPKPILPREGANCSSEIFRCTLTKIPETQSLLQKARLPLGILIHPFRDVSHLPVIQTSTIVRCRSCRTYINPYVQFVEQQRWKCNICFRFNVLPDDFMYDPVSRKYGEPERRPEIQNATVEFIAPSEYMLRPPQPAVYLFVLDVSHGAVQTGYLDSFCKIMLEELNNLPGDSRTQVGFITFDSSVHFYNLGEGMSVPEMLLVSDIDEVFLPSPDSLLVNIHECKTLVQYLLESLPTTHSQNGETASALGAAVQAAYKLVSSIGGRVSVFQTCLPTVGPGSLKPREDPNQRAGKEIANLLPGTDFYKKLALDCSGQQVAVDLFLLGSQYMDVASIACISKYSAGCVYYYPGFHSGLNKPQVEKFEMELRYYVTRKIGFEAVMRIRCTKGLAMHTFHGNFFVRSTDLLSLPNINPDAGFSMQLAIEESLTECNVASFQAAVLYTSSQGERRIRVHTLSLPVTALVQDVLSSVDQEAVVGLLCKMAVDRSLSSSVLDARDAMINACLDLIQAFQLTLPSGQAAVGGLPIPYCARLLPLYMLALTKHTAFRIGVSTKLDDRVFAMEQMKTMPLSYLMTYIYPAMYPVHMLNDQNAIQAEDGTLIPQPPRLQLTFEKVDRHGCYLLDTVDRMYLYVGRAVSDHFCMNVLGVPQFAAIPEDMMELPELDTPESELVRSFVLWVLSQRPYYSPLRVIREDSKERHLFVQHLVDDRTESALSYYEFLQHLKQQLSK